MTKSNATPKNVVIRKTNRTNEQCFRILARPEIRFEKIAFNGRSTLSYDVTILKSTVKTTNRAFTLYRNPIFNNIAERELNPLFISSKYIDRYFLITLYGTYVPVRITLILNNIPPFFLCFMLPLNSIPIVGLRYVLWKRARVIYVSRIYRSLRITRISFEINCIISPWK